MKKFISCFLIFVVSLSTSPVQIFAQDLGYKPAFSFKYDYYGSGTNLGQFIANLEDDLLNVEDYVDPKDLAPQPKPGAYGNKWGSPEHLRETYNSILYYNIYPEKSPLWSKTALVPGKGATEKDVMTILDRHHGLSEAISYRLRENPEYKRSIIEKHVRLVPVYIVLLGLAYISWAIAPEALSLTIPCTGLAVTIPKWVSFIALMAADILITDEVAWGMTKIDENLDNLYQYVGSYKSAGIRIARDTELLKPVKETEYDRIQQELEKMTKNATDAQTKKDIELIKRYFTKGFSGVFSGINKEKNIDRLRIVLGKFLYDVFDGDEELINEYFRKEMLRTYYALVFIEEELDNESDPLRYDRAFIDLATTYKIQNIQIIDNRVRKINAEPEVISFGENLRNSCNISGENADVSRKLLRYINQETENLIGAELEDQTSVAYTYPTLLTRAEVNYIVQLMDINKKEKERARIKQRLDSYAEQARLAEEMRRPSDYRVPKTGNANIDRAVHNAHPTGYFNLTSTK